MTASTHATRLAMLVTVTLSLATVPTLPAHALGCPQQRLEDQVLAADVIFSGRARDMNEALATTFEVDRVYKGNVAVRVVVETGRVKYAMLSPPDRYLVLAHLSEDVTKSGNLYHHQCSGSLRAPWPASVQEMLGEGRAPLARGKPPRSGNPATDATEPATTLPDPIEPIEPTPVAERDPPAETTPAAMTPKSRTGTPTVSRLPAPTDPTPPPIPTRGCGSCSLPGRTTHDWLLAFVLLALTGRPRAPSRTPRADER